MAASINSDTQLLTEHFGYPPVSLIDDIINSVNILAERALNSVEQGLLNAAPATIGFKAPKNAKPTDNAPDPGELAKNEVEAGTHQLETLMCTSIDRNFDKLEIYLLRNILCVKPVDIQSWIRLGHYAGLDFSSVQENTGNEDGETSASGDKPTLGSIGQLRRKLRESMRLNALLHEEQQRNEQLLADLRGLVGARHDKVKHENASADDDNNHPGPLTFLRDGAAQLKDAGGDTPLSTTTAFTLSQLQALRALSTSLRTMAPHLKPAEGAEENVDDGKRSWRRERLEYVESATRRHLESVQGLELGKDGEIRDGEWQAEGRNLGKGEVESLERVVSLLGGEAGATTSASRGNEERMDES